VFQSAITKQQLMARYILFLLLVISMKAMSQKEDCEQTLNHASAEFDAGRFYSLPSILKPCIDNGFSKEQKVRAYLLLTQSYLILNDPIAAENSYLQLLTADPEYVANPVRDPVDVYYLSKKFTTTPVFTPTFQAGVNATIPQTIYVSNPSATTTNSQNGYKIGYQVGGALDWNINERWSVSLGLAYSKKTFKYDGHNPDSGDDKSFIEKQDWIDVPLYLKYTRDSGIVRPFGYVGVAANLLLDAKLSAKETDLNSPIRLVQQISQGPDRDISYKRNFFNRSVVVGGGIKYKVGKNFLVADVRYFFGLNNVARNPYSGSDGKVDNLLISYQYASDFFRLDNFSLNLGFVKPLYDPRKRNPAVAGLLQKLGLKKGKRK
jgi:hypothetical protein